MFLFLLLNWTGGRDLQISRKLVPKLDEHTFGHDVSLQEEKKKRAEESDGEERHKIMSTDLLGGIE